MAKSDMLNECAGRTRAGRNNRDSNTPYLLIHKLIFLLRGASEREPWQTCRPYCDGSIGQIGAIIGAVTALGAAAQGLVDVTKGFWINVDVSGFTFIKQSL